MPGTAWLTYTTNAGVSALAVAALHWPLLTLAALLVATAVDQMTTRAQVDE